MDNFDKDLNQLRKAIDSLDDELISILAKRIALVRRVGKKKAELSLKPLDIKRWKKVRSSRITSGKVAGLSRVFVQSMFEVIHRHSLLIQKGIRL